MRRAKSDCHFWKKRLFRNKSTSSHTESVVSKHPFMNGLRISIVHGGFITWPVTNLSCLVWLGTGVQNTAPRSPLSLNLHRLHLTTTFWSTLRTTAIIKISRSSSSICYLCHLLPTSKPWLDVYSALDPSCPVARRNRDRPPSHSSTTSPTLS